MSNAGNREFLNEIDAAIRQGLIRQAASRIQELWKGAQSLSRPERLELARLARRAYLPGVAILLLRPWVRPSSARAMETEARPEETLEFASALIAVGARTEGVELLKSVDASRFPERDLFASFALFSSWDYASALPLLRRYTRHKGLSEYARLVGRANLAAALVHERKLEEAAVELMELDTLARAGSHALLLRNILKLEAERAIYAGQFEQAERCLTEAHSMSGKSPEDDLYLEKWRAIASLASGDSAGLVALKRVRGDAHRLGEWEGARDCDYHLAVYGKDLGLGTRLVFGTPYPAYRTCLLRDLPVLQEALPDRFGWELGASRGRRTEIWLESGTIAGSQGFLKPGQVPERLFKALASDFYRPFNLVELHSLVFPTQHYHPRSSADSMHQSLRRLRAYFCDHRIPLRVSESRGHYRLEAKAPVKLWVGECRSAQALDPGMARELEQLRASLSKGRQRYEFTAREAATIWGISRNSALDRLRRLQSQKVVERQGRGPETSYRLMPRTEL